MFFIAALWLPFPRTFFFFLVCEIMCKFCWKNKKDMSIMVTLVGHSLFMASHFVNQHCGSFIHLMLPYIRGVIFSFCWDAGFTHKLQLFKKQMCILGSVDVLNILGLAKTHGPLNRPTSPTGLLQQTEVAQLSMY